MCCCTYLTDSQYTKPTSDSELNTLLSDVRKATGHDWRIEEIEVEVRRWFRRPRTIKLYALYSHTVVTEFQIINFYRPDRGEWSMNFANEAGYVAAYLYGMLATIDAKLAERGGKGVE